MNIFEIIKKLEKSDVFASWRAANKKAYLAHAFKTDEMRDLWEIGYFNPKTNLITVFNVNNKITRNPDSEVFKEENALVNELNIKKVKINENSAIKSAEKILNENYKGMAAIKTFMILQNLDKIGQVWNITFVTGQFKTINVKIDSDSGICKSHKEISLIEGRK